MGSSVLYPTANLDETPEQTKTRQLGLPPSIAPRFFGGLASHPLLNAVPPSNVGPQQAPPDELFGQLPAQPAPMAQASMPAPPSLGVAAPPPKSLSEQMQTANIARSSLPVTATEPHMNISKRILGTMLEMSTNPAMSNLGARWLHPEAVKLEAQKSEADKRVDAVTKQAQIENIQSEIENRGADRAKGEHWTVIPGALGPQGEPVQEEATTGQIRVVTTPGVTMKEGKVTPERLEKADLVVGGKEVGGSYSPATGKYTDAQGNVIQNPQFYHKPEGEGKPSSDDKAIADYLTANHLTNTAENRNIARKFLQTQKAEIPIEARLTGDQKKKLQEFTDGRNIMRGLMKVDDPPSNYNFLMNFVGMSYKMVRGARLTKAELDKAGRTRTLPDEAQHYWDLYVDRKGLTLEQKQEMMGSVQRMLDSLQNPGPANTGAVTRDPNTGRLKIKGVD
jgi:hypothetical protein